MFQWVRRFFHLNAEEQNALFLTTTELRMFCHGLRGVTGFDTNGSLFSSSVSPDTAKWAIPYAELIRSGDVLILL